MKASSDSSECSRNQKLQEILKFILPKIGFPVDSLVDDGDYGPETRAAVSVLQHFLGVKVTGEFDAVTAQAFSDKMGVDFDAYYAAVCSVQSQLNGQPVSAS